MSSYPYPDPAHSQTRSPKHMCSQQHTSDTAHPHMHAHRHKRVPLTPSQHTHGRTHVHIYFHTSSSKACLHRMKGQMPPRSLLLSCSILLHLIPLPRICWQFQDQWPGSHAPGKSGFHLPRPSWSPRGQPLVLHILHSLASSVGYLERTPSSFSPPCHARRAHPDAARSAADFQDWSLPGKPWV